MSIEIILNEFRQNRGYFPKEAVQEAIRQKEELTGEDWTKPPVPVRQREEVQKVLRSLITRT